MGWYRVANLEVAGGFSDCPEGPAIWSRGGLEDVNIQSSNGEFIRLPREIILGLAADEFRSKRISHYESMDTDDCLREMGLLQREREK